MQLIADVAHHEVEQLMLAAAEAGAVPGAAVDAVCIAAVRYHLVEGGQRVRSRLALHAGASLGLESADAVRLAATVELLHNASLVHDDLQDQESVRRGRASVWAAFGKDVALCVGDLLLSSAYGALSSFSRPALLPELLRCVHQRTAHVIRGQCAELAGRDRPVTSLAEYEQIVAGKSSALLSLPLELAFIAAGEAAWGPRIWEAARSFGVGYQMVDDLDDVSADAENHTLNAVLLLETLFPADDARSLVRRQARAHLENAAALASTLPGGSGSLLAEYSSRLVLRLQRD
jgi:geranylgeranyl pyrophosphate synthase